mgnify:CR=1 FL=1
MNPLDVTRRQFLGKGLSLSIGAPALHTLLAGESLAASGPAKSSMPALAELPHFAPRAKRIIYMMQSGGPSHVDLFDDKETLGKRQGEQMPASSLGNLR